VVIQRRALRFKTALEAGTVLAEDHLEALRPCPDGAVSPDALLHIVGKRLSSDKDAGKELLWTDLEQPS
jgi:N-acetylneuraminate synthase